MSEARLSGAAKSSDIIQTFWKKELNCYCCNIQRFWHCHNDKLSTVGISGEGA